MAERVFRSAGVFATETDLSQPTRQGPVGTPAGVIGTANFGPAFVPITVGNYGDFTEIFGATDGEKFGPLAVYNFLQNATALTYLRVLGVGDGLQRSTSTGKVNNAGFAVGGNQVQASGDTGINKHAVALGDPGRTYFLGTFMSQSAGSTVFSSAGIQGTAVGNGARATLLLTTVSNTKADYATGTFTLTDAAGVEVTFLFANGTPGGFSGAPTTGQDAGAVGGTAGQICIQVSAAGDSDAVATQVAAAINASKLAVVAAVASSEVTVTQQHDGSGGNTLTSRATVTDDAVYSLPSNFSGGADRSDAAVPIIRGIIFAASGVIPQLSSSLHGAGTQGQPNNTDPATQGAATLKGSISGSVDVATQQFTMLLNGHVDTSDYPNVVTASFNSSDNSYFAKQFNTDPLKIEEAGYCLYTHYDINPAFATVTGSHAVAGSVTRGDGSVLENIGFLVTGSADRDSAVANVAPNYESFEDRFQTARTPFFISQDYGGKKYDLFRVHAVSDGEASNNYYKISITNINPPSNDASTDYGTFNLEVRSFFDRDQQKEVYETWIGLSLDPSSDKYIARVIGDRHTFFDFDQSKNSQKLVVKGDHAGNSARIRVEMSNDLLNGNIPDTALPMGFRGPDHLVTSGSGPLADFVTSGLSGSAGYMNQSPLKRAQEVPLRYREDVKKPVPGAAIVDADTRLYWGAQFAFRVKDALVTTAGTTSLRSLNDGNALFDSSMQSRTKFFPQFFPNEFNFTVGNNPNQSDVNGTVLNCDRYHNNLFTLENIRVRTGSAELHSNRADNEQWHSASYVRKGAIAADETNKTRALKLDDLRQQTNRAYAKFTTFLQGGFDGTNIFNKDQKNLTTNAARREMTNVTNLGGVKGNTVASYRKAIDIMGVKSDVEINLLAIPGIRTPGITNFAMDAMESRFDAFYIMDIEQRDELNTVITASSEIDPLTGGTKAVVPHVTNTVTDFASRGLNSSFAAAYFPDIKIQDPGTNSSVIAPPSVGVLGSYALNDKSQVWFAPAGFTRGLLSNSTIGPGGIFGTAKNLNRDNLDDLYSERINPIVSFESKAPVVWGQKTLLADASALDRVNVRRLLINIRRQVRAVANSILFEPNRQETLDKFNSLVKPILTNAQKNSGVDRFKVVIDTTTTTQADVENNTIRGKIFLQPTRTAEFVALDFTVTNAGNFDTI